MYYQPQPNYRRLGGWLMFIKVIAILQIVSSGYSLLTTPFNTATVYMPAWYRVLNVFLAMAMLALSICTLVFLGRRQLQQFRLSWLSYFGVAVVSAAAGSIMFSLNQYAMLSYMRQSSPYYTSYSSSEKQVFDAMIMKTLDFVLALFIVGVFVQIGMLIAWYYYLQRSKRVAVYFDPNYVEPLLQYYPYGAPYYPQAGQTGGYYGQAPYLNSYPPQGYYPQQGEQYPYAGPYGYTAPPPSQQAPLPQQGQPAPPVQQETTPPPQA